MIHPKEVRIEYASPKLIPSFRRTLDVVAREKVYLEIQKAFPLAKVRAFQMGLIRKRAPVFYAIHDGRVVGWCDICPKDNPRMRHRANLGMGILPEYRGIGIGARLMKASLAHAKARGLEKVELFVYTSNKRAIALYEKIGFKREGLIKRYRKVGSRHFDCIMMAKFLK